MCRFNSPLILFLEREEKKRIFIFWTANLIWLTVDSLSSSHVLLFSTRDTGRLGRRLDGSFVLVRHVISFFYFWVRPLGWGQGEGRREERMKCIDRERETAKTELLERVSGVFKRQLQHPLWLAGIRFSFLFRFSCLLGLLLPPSKCMEHKNLWKKKENFKSKKGNNNNNKRRHNERKKSRIFPTKTGK